MVLHEPSRHEEHAFYVQSTDIILDFGFAVKVLGAGDFARSHFRDVGKRGLNYLSHASGDAKHRLWLPLSYLHGCRGFVPD